MNKRHMRRFLAGGVWFAVLALVLAGCIGEDGPAGPKGDTGDAGPKGDTGDAGPEGPAGTTVCMDCHSDDYAINNYLLPYEAEFETSRHAEMETYIRRSSPCSRCHTNEGHQIYLATGAPQAITTSSKIGCFTCHAPHSTLDFALRKTTPAVLDQGAGTYDKGGGNACAVCHQVRVPNPGFADGGTAITSFRWGPHYSSHANLLGGAGFYVFQGASYNTTATHQTIADGCVGCHMAELAGNQTAGGHSFAMTYDNNGVATVNSKGCGCHGWNDTQATAAVAAKRTSFDTAVAELGELIYALGWLMDDRYYVRTAGAPTAEADRGALYNYLMLKRDKSGGLHNPDYTASVLAATRTYIETRP